MARFKLAALKKLVTNPYFILAVWIVMALASYFNVLKSGGHNNYLIFKYMFPHVLDQVNLYLEYPDLYADHTHYGPAFSMFIMPFAILPDWLGILLFQLASIAFVFVSLKKLEYNRWQFAVVAWLIVNELYRSLVCTQFNAIAATLFILAFVLVKKDKPFWAALPIMFGAFVKLYGIIGLAFFLFSKDKKQFVIGCVVWSIVIFVLPMLFSSPEYVVQSYIDWYQRLSVKNSSNLTETIMHQNQSIMGLLTAIGFKNVSPTILIGILSFLFLIPFARYKMYFNNRFQYLALASCLIFPILISSSAELATYIFIYLGIGIWFVSHDRPISKYMVALLILAVLSSATTTDLFPKFVRNFVRNERLSVIPALFIWLTIVYQMLTLRKIENEKINH